MNGASGQAAADLRAPARDGRPAGRAPRWRRAVLLVALAALATELVGFAGVAALRWLRPHMYYRPGPVDADAWQRYLARRDPDLGWSRGKNASADGYDAAGSRLVPAFPDPAQPALISLYGDSMTESLEVDDEAAWGNQLARLVGTRVANFGVAGYGTDQAYLRFLHESDDRAPIVVLNHFSDDIVRNVNQWRYLISSTPGSEMTFKPRFLADGERLDLVPLPTPTYDEFLACTEDPARCVGHEYFLPDDGRSGVQSIRLPYTLTLLRSLDNFFLKPKLAGVPRHFSFYEPGHPSEALRVTELVLRDFVAEAERRGRLPLVTVIPDGKDLEYSLAHGAWPYQSLVDEMRSEHRIEVLDFGPGIVARLAGRSPCAIIHRCYDHFNAEGYRILAELAHEHLVRSGLLARGRAKLESTP